MSRSCRTGAYASLQGRADFRSIPDALHLMAHIELQCAHVSPQVFLSAEYQCRAGGYRRNIWAHDESQLPLREHLHCIMMACLFCCELRLRGHQT